MYLPGSTALLLLLLLLLLGHARIIRINSSVNTSAGVVLGWTLLGARQRQKSVQVLDPGHSDELWLEPYAHVHVVEWI